MLKRLFSEPLVVFAILGAGLFALFAVTAAPFGDAVDDRLITVNSGDIDLIDENCRALWRRYPTESERAALVEAFIREEVMVREALALGLDRGDAVIRQRLNQKMVFLLSAAANAMTPTDDELTAHVTAVANRFRRRARSHSSMFILAKRSRMTRLTRS